MMRGSYRNSKKGSARHNDRSFDLDRADHIDRDRMKKNEYFTINGIEDFTQSEIEYYRQHFGAALAAINANYINQRHADRAKTIAEYYEAHPPTESIFQIGDKSDHISAEKLSEVYADFCARRESYCQEHDLAFTRLNSALHADEKTPHIHERSVISYEDRDGHERPGQEEGFRQAGIDLPDPAAPEGRKNNRMMTFTADMRQLWYEVIRDHEIEIETEPLPSRRHLEKEEFITQQLRQDRARAEHELEQVAAAKELALDRARRQLKKEIQAERSGLEAELDALQAATEAQREQFELLQQLNQAEAERFENEASRLEKIKKELEAELGFYDAEKIAQARAEAAEIYHSVIEPMRGAPAQKTPLKELKRILERTEKGAAETGDYRLKDGAEKLQRWIDAREKVARLKNAPKSIEEYAQQIAERELSRELTRTHKHDLSR